MKFPLVLRSTYDRVVDSCDNSLRIERDKRLELERYVKRLEAFLPRVDIVDESSEFIAVHAKVEKNILCDKEGYGEASAIDWLGRFVKAEFTKYLHGDRESWIGKNRPSWIRE